MFYKTSKILIVIAFVAIYIIWGSTYLFNKIAVSELPPFFLASIRFFIAGVLMIGLAIFYKQKLYVSKNQLLKFNGKGFCLNLFGDRSTKDYLRVEEPEITILCSAALIKWFLHTVVSAQ